MKPPKHLIIVAGHAVYTSNNFTTPENDENWCLQSFQKGEGRYYIQHIKKGLELVAKDETSVLFFSGGATRKEAGNISEAESYYRLSEHLNEWEPRFHHQVFKEENARNSLENLWFSILEFKQNFNCFPKKISLISWEFKRERFLWHCKTLGYPVNNFEFIGVNQPENLADILKAEEDTLKLFKKDPWGINPPLKDKTEERNPFNREPKYSISLKPIRMNN